MSAISAYPLSTLLSWLLVAFTVEFDNDFEHLMPHSTTGFDSTAGGPWLVSMAMYLSCMRYVPPEGIRVGQLADAARTGTNLHGMARWRYINIGPDSSNSRAKTPKSEWLILPTPAGLKAREIWRPLFGSIEKRWRTRFGAERIHRLRSALCAVITQIPFHLPDYLPILGYGLFTKGHIKKQSFSGVCQDSPLPTLLAQVLMSIAVRFENEFDVSLAICANLLRVLDEPGVSIRDIPAISGVSKQAISMAMGILQKKQLAVLAPDEKRGRGKVAGLTIKGVEAQAAYQETLSKLEKRLEVKFGNEVITALRQSLEIMTADLSLLFASMEPYPDGWRASVPKPQTLPHYPIVLHRGGFPDGS